MPNYLSPALQGLKPYVPGEQPKTPGLVKLNTNENPYPPSPQVTALLSKNLDTQLDKLRYYPDPQASALKAAIASLYDLTPAQVFVGNGSDEVLALAFFAFFQQAKPLLLPDITYSFYTVWAQLFNITTHCMPLTQDWRIDLSTYKQPNGGVVFANPNAPTGMSLLPESIETLLQVNTDSVILVDEAYIDFGGQSMAPLVTQYPQLLVVQTLSKSRSLAGLRVGFALGDEHLIQALEQVKHAFHPYSVGYLSQVIAQAAIEDVAYFNQCRDRLMATREATREQLLTWGFDVLPSQTNFLWAKPPGMPAAQWFQRLREQKILLRYFDKPRVNEYLRISIGTEDAMAQCLAAIKGTSKN